MRTTSSKDAKGSVLANRDIHHLAIAELTVRAKNPRTHSRRQIKQIARSIERFGFINPVLVDRTRRIVCGHGRVAAARLLGLEGVPTITLEHLSETELRAYVLTDNRLAEKAGWDKEILSIELEGLYDLGFDVEVTGFEIPELEFDADAHDDTLPNLVSDRVITEQGDLWVLGEHRLICGDPRSREAFTSLLGEDRAQLVFVSPSELHARLPPSGRIERREIVQARERRLNESRKLLEETLGLLVEHSENGAIHFVCADWQHIGKMLLAGRRIYRELRDLVVWDKANGEKHSFYRNQHELIFVWESGRGQPINIVKHRGRNRSNVWTYAVAKTRNLDGLNTIPTAKPVALVADAIRDGSRRGDIVLDNFGGSGTTVIACERTHRKARVIELDPTCCDQTVRRWQRLTGRQATNPIKRLYFDELASLPPKGNHQ
jgi:DNA methylase/ParB/Sulfiredoxin domain